MTPPESNKYADWRDFYKRVIPLGSYTKWNLKFIAKVPDSHYILIIFAAKIVEE